MKTIVSAAVAAIAASPAMAQGLYINGGANLVDIDGDVLSNPEGEYQAGTVFGNVGFDFTKNFGAELDIQVGVSDAEATDNFAMTEDRISINTFAGVYAKAGVPLADFLWIGGRVGAVGGDLDVEIVDQVTGQSFSGEGSVSGIGYGGVVTVDFASNMFLRFDYTRYDLEDDGDASFEADSFALSLGMRF